MADRFREVMLDGQWVAKTNFHLALSDVYWKQAVTKVGGLNSIASLTYHVNYYIEGLLTVFNGGELVIRDKYSFDMKPITSQEDWKHLCASLMENSERFAKAVEEMEDEQLDAVFIDEKYGNFQRNIDSIIEHGYYHLGQISLLKKLIMNQ